MAKKIHYSEEMKECPYCGGGEFYIRQSYRGETEYNYRFDGKETDNSEMYDYATYRNLTKYAYCKSCRKRLFPIKEFYESRK